MAYDAGCLWAVIGHGREGTRGGRNIKLTCKTLSKRIKRFESDFYKNMIISDPNGINVCKANLANDIQPFECNFPNVIT